jgi:hypothetical protein
MLDKSPVAARVSWLVPLCAVCGAVAGVLLGGCLNPLPADPAREEDAAPVVPGEGSASNSPPNLGAENVVDVPLEDSDLGPGAPEEPQNPAGAPDAGTRDAGVDGG